MGLFTRDNTAENPVRVTVTARTLANICEEVKAGWLYGESVEVLSTWRIGTEVTSITLHYTARTMGVTYVTWVRGEVPTPEQVAAYQYGEWPGER